MSNPFTTKDPLVDIIKQVVLGEKKLTDAELKKREEIVLAIKRENPDMEKSRAYAIATAQAKKVAEEVELDEAMKPFTDADHATADKHGTKIEKNLENIKKVPTKHLQYLHHHNMGYASSGGYLHHALPHIETELKKRGKKPLSDEDGEKVFNEEVNLDEHLENFWEAYTTMFNEAEDQQQNLLLRAMAKDTSDLMKMKRAIKMGDKALTNPALRQEILKMLDQMMTLTTGDKSLLQRTRMGFQKAKTMKMPEEVQLEEVEELDERNKENAMRRKMMDASRGARYKLANKAVPNPEPEHKTAQAHNKAIGRALRNEAIGAKDKQDEGEYGYEGDMAMSQLRTIIRNSEEMMKVLKKDTDLPEWVQSKITLATDYLQTANDYLMSELEEEVEIDEDDLSVRTLYNKYADRTANAKNTKPVEKAIKKVHGSKVLSHMKKAASANIDTKFDKEKQHFDKARKAAGNTDMIGATVGKNRSAFRKQYEEVELGEADEKEVGKEVKAARLKKDSSDFMSKSSLFSGGARDVAKHLGKKDDEKYGEAMKKVKDTPVSKFVASRKGDGTVHTNEEAEKTPFEGGHEVKSTESAAERVKRIATDAMQKQQKKDKK